MTIISHDISAADEPELLKTLASLARRKGARVANRSAAFTVSDAATVKRPRDIEEHVRRVKPGLPPWGPHVRFRQVQTLVREGSPLVKLRNSA